MTLSRSDHDGFFHCLWCVNQKKPDRGKTRLKSAQDMRVSGNSHLNLFSVPPANDRVLPESSRHLQRAKEGANGFEKSTFTASRPSRPS